MCILHVTYNPLNREPGTDIKDLEEGQYTQKAVHSSQRVTGMIQFKVLTTLPFLFLLFSVQEDKFSKSEVII